jgi:hypothetical protein
LYFFVDVGVMSIFDTQLAAITLNLRFFIARRRQSCRYLLGTITRGLALVVNSKFGPVALNL